MGAEGDRPHPGYRPTRISRMKRHIGAKLATVPESSFQFIRSSSSTARILSPPVPFSAQAQEPETTMQLDRNGTLPTTKVPRGELHRRRLHQRLLRARSAEPAGRCDRYLHPRRTHALEVEPARSDADRDKRRRLEQCEGEEIVEIRAGDVIGCPPGIGTGTAPRPIMQ
jgi:hypothetical protein